MVSVFKQPLTAADIKAKARALGADLVGIADGATLERHPPDPRDPRRPSDITDLDGGRVIVLAKRVSRGSARIAAWNDRHKYYNDELALSRLEEASLELVYWLEDNGYPAIIVPPTHVDPWRYDGNPNRHHARYCRCRTPRSKRASARSGSICNCSRPNSDRAYCSPQCSARSMLPATKRWKPRCALARAAGAASRLVRPTRSGVGPATGRPAIVSGRRMASHN